MHDADDPKSPKALSFASFLESIPPGERRSISNLATTTHKTRVAPRANWEMDRPDVQLHCPTQIKCNGSRIFRCSSYSPDQWIRPSLKVDVFSRYVCRNCEEYSKTYSIRIDWKKDDPVPTAMKFGEFPSFGAPLPPRLRRFTGDDHELFLKGWRSECRGLGIGSFSYYRRVVESQKGRIIAEIRKAAVHLQASDELLERLDQAKQETQFTKAIDLVKDAIPDGIRVKGHNPLTLLHRPLSIGLHNLSDEQCLEQAAAIRVILAELASKIARVTAEDKELKSAISTLLSSD